MNIEVSKSLLQVVGEMRLLLSKIGVLNNQIKIGQRKL